MGRRHHQRLFLQHVVRHVTGRCCSFPVAVLLLVTVTGTCDGHSIPRAATAAVTATAATSATVERRQEVPQERRREEVVMPTGMQSEQEVEQLKRTILQGLGLSRTPDVAKMNVSQEEYSRMYQLYLQTVEANARTHVARSQPKVQRFFSFTHAKDRARVRRTAGETTWLYFPVDIPESRQQQHVDVESATLRLFVSANHQPTPGGGGGGGGGSPAGAPTTVHVRVYQVLQPSPDYPTEEERLLVDQKEIQLFPFESKWTDFDVTRAAQAWNIGGNETNYGLELACRDCARKGVTLVTQQTSGSNSSVSPVLNLLAGVHLGTREKRAADPMSAQERQREVCHKDGVNCCRHVMKVNFKKIPGLEYILQPREFDAGYCKGRCPPAYNHASHHAILQTLIRKLQNHSETRVPRVCCAPSRLRALEVLHLDMENSTKLTLTTWENMEVLECACS